MEAEEWRVVTPGKANCKHKWKLGISFIWGHIRTCERKLCREKQFLWIKGMESK